MKGPRQFKRSLNRYRRRAARAGQKNGGWGWLDDPWLERLAYNSKRLRESIIPNHKLTEGGE